MKQQRYIIRVEEGRVSVTHRVRFVRIISVTALTFVVYVILTGSWRAVVDLHNSHDPFAGLFTFLVLLIPLWSAATWLFATSGEVVHCDAQELHCARRRIWGRWQRHHFKSAQVRGLRRIVRGASRSRTFIVLTFQYDGQTFDMLENLQQADSDRILQACKSMGLDAIIPVDAGAAMQRDIVQRGWWVNPWRPDRDR